MPQSETGAEHAPHELHRKDSAYVTPSITPVSRIPKRWGEADSREKRNMNPNVAIELGYAQHALGDEQVLMVLNEHYGDREFLRRRSRRSVRSGFP